MTSLQIILSTLTPCLGFVSVFAILFGFFAFIRYMGYRERLALAEKGLMQAEPARRNGKDTLRWGIITTAVGLALCIGVGVLPLIGFVLASSRPGTSGPGPAEISQFLGPGSLIGLLPTFFGLGLILIYVLTHEEKSKDETSKADKTEEPPRSL